MAIPLVPFINTLLCFGLGRIVSDCLFIANDYLDPYRSLASFYINYTARFPL